jgi:hexosaminidase
MKVKSICSCLVALVCLSSVAAENFWWKFAGKDCDGAKNKGDDLPTQPACHSGAKGNVAELEKCCLATKDCAGFNTNGVMKAAACESHIDFQWAGDLYILKDSPQPPPPPPPAANMPWPAPKSFTTGTTNITVSSGFKFTGVGSIPTLVKAIARYQDLTFPHPTDAATDSPKADLTSLDITVADTDESHPQYGTDESYTLGVGSSGQATLKAATIYGAMRGLETFSQLVLYDFDTMSYNIQNGPWSINDAPRFQHRGLMIDSARHYDTLASVRGIVDSLSYAKCNVLHWHMSDSQSFPFQSKTHPKMWEGAYSPQEKYTQADIAEMVEYARLRGIRVMVEFDMPGHAGSWCKGERECSE